MNDITEITQIVLLERQGRDRGWWAQMAKCFHPDSRVTLRWFDGPGPEFVSRSQKMFEMGIRILHRPHSESRKLPLGVPRDLVRDASHRLAN